MLSRNALAIFLGVAVALAGCGHRAITAPGGASIDESPEAVGWDSPVAPEDDAWDPLLQYSDADIRRRLEAMLGIEDDFDFIVAYWKLVWDSHRAETMLYQGGRGVVNRSVFLMRERPKAGGWRLLGDDGTVTDIRAVPAVIILSLDGKTRTIELDPHDTVLVTSEDRLLITDIEDVGATIVPAIHPVSPEANPAPDIDQP
jgi:hypothetical protein